MMHDVGMLSDYQRQAVAVTAAAARMHRTNIRLVDNEFT
jgi:hypothetical protein